MKNNDQNNSVRKTLKHGNNLLRRTIQCSVTCLILASHSLAIASDITTPIQSANYARLGDAIQLPELNTLDSFLSTWQFRKRAILGNSAGFEIDTSQREQSRNAYNSLFSASFSVTPEWDGDVSSCDPGSTSDAYKQAVLTRINYFRAMAGVPATISLNASYNNKAQQAALMMAAENNLSHTPNTSWACYTTDGAEAASHSNLSLGNAGYDAVFSQMRDNGSNNAPVGHRRWLLFPQTQEMGTGSIPATNGHNSANDIWVIDSHLSDSRPITREAFVSWPPAGYTPASLAFNRWSFSWPKANFTSATVTMTRLDNSASEPLVIEHRSTGSGAGESTIVWDPDNIDSSNVNEDTSWEITISNFVVNGIAKTESYQVTLFDPAQTDQNSVTPMITGEQASSINSQKNYQFSQVANADGYEYLLSQTSQTPVYDAEGVLHTDLEATISAGYNIIETNQPAGDGAVYHLAHTTAVSQFLTINKTLSVDNNAQITFDSLLGFAAQDQIAQLQISIDHGTSWTNIYQRAGSGGANDTSFHPVTVSFSDYAQRLINLRFVYAFESGSFYPQSSSSVGWFIDNIQMQNVQLLATPTIQTINQGHNGNFPLTFTQPGDHLLAVRATVFGGYPLEWGDSFALTATNNNTGSQISILNADGSSETDALTDGLLILRHMFGFTGTALTNSTVQTDCIFCDAPAIINRLDSLQTELDIDGNGITDALTDGLLIIRYLFGSRDTALTLGAVSNNCSRCDSTTIEVYLAGLV
ncbi:MAG: CAP domain-containing protein [Methylococcales bacterium]